MSIQKELVKIEVTTPLGEVLFYFKDDPKAYRCTDFDGDVRFSLETIAL